MSIHELSGQAISGRRPRVVVIDDSTVIRGGFATVHPDVEVVAAYASVEEFQAMLPECDVVMLDLLLRGPQGSNLNVKQGRGAIEAVREAGYPVCLYTDERRVLVLALCLRAGANGVVHKSDRPEATMRAIHDIAAGQVAITQSLVGLAELLDRRGAGLELSERQRQVISARARGHQWAVIAKTLYITEDTARDHYRAACAKLRRYLVDVSPGDLERSVGAAPGDVLDQD